jgi:alpha-tubulin suppressor-like RCC1 family protein
VVFTNPPAQVTDLVPGKILVAGISANTPVWAWGWNGYGELGDGITTERHTPVQVAGLTGVTAVTAGEEEHSLAIAGP